MKQLTIYTPTYNREKLLTRVYNSLLKQDVNLFKWLVIDDGSTDNTRKLINSFINEKKIEIEYYYKKNGGVHTAREMAFEKCDTELIMSLDSDDWMIENSVKKILDFWNKKKSDDIIGIFCPAIVANNFRKASEFPKIEKSSFQFFTYKLNYKGDKATVIRANIIKNTKKYPVYDDEKLVGESYKWIQLPNDKYFVLFDEPIINYDYQDNGYSNQGIKNLIKNPKGFKANYLAYIKYSKYLKPLLRGIIGYISASLFIGDKKIIRNSPKPVLTFIFFPFGFVRFLKIKKIKGN